MSYQSIYNDINLLISSLKPFESTSIEVVYGFTFNIKKSRNNYYVITYWKDDDDIKVICLDRTNAIKFILELSSIKPP